MFNTSSPSPERIQSKKALIKKVGRNSFPDLSHSEAIIIREMALLSDDKGYLFCSYSGLAKRCHFKSSRTAIRAVNGLISKNLLFKRATFIPGTDYNHHNDYYLAGIMEITDGQYLENPWRENTTLSVRKRPVWVEQFESVPANDPIEKSAPPLTECHPYSDRMSPYILTECHPTDVLLETLKEEKQQLYNLDIIEERSEPEKISLVSGSDISISTPQQSISESVVVFFKKEEEVKMETKTIDESRYPKDFLRDGYVENGHHPLWQHCLNELRKDFPEKSEAHKINSKFCQCESCINDYTKFIYPCDAMVLNGSLIIYCSNQYAFNDLRDKYYEKISKISPLPVRLAIGCLSEYISDQDNKKSFKIQEEVKYRDQEEIEKMLNTKGLCAEMDGDHKIPISVLEGFRDSIKSLLPEETQDNLNNLENKMVYEARFGSLSKDKDGPHALRCAFSSFRKSRYWGEPAGLRAALGSIKESQSNVVNLRPR